MGKRLIVGIIAVLILGGIGVYFLYSNNSSEDIKTIIEKTDPITGKRALSLYAEDNKEGLERAEITEEHLEKIMNFLLDKDYEGLEKYGVTTEELALLILNEKLSLKPLRDAVTEESRQAFRDAVTEESRQAY